MTALNIKKGASKHSAYDLRDPNADVIERHTLAIIVDNEAGVLARVIGLFSGRGYNIESLTVAEIDHTGHTSRITIVTTGTPAVIEQIKAQLGRIVPVHEVHDLTVEGASVERELALFKVAGTATSGSRPCVSRISSARTLLIQRWKTSPSRSPAARKRSMPSPISCDPSVCRKWPGQVWRHSRGARTTSPPHGSSGEGRRHFSVRASRSVVGAGVGLETVGRLGDLFYGRLVCVAVFHEPHLLIGVE